MCDPSIAPKHCGKPHCCSNPLTMSLAWGPVGILMYLLRSTSTIALHTSRTMTQAVETPTPKRWEMVQYSTFVPTCLNAIATLFSTDTAVRMLVLLVLACCSFPLSSVHKCWKVVLFTRKCIFHSRSFQDAVILVKDWLRFLTQSTDTASYYIWFDQRWARLWFHIHPPPVGRKRLAIVFELLPSSVSFSYNTFFFVFSSKSSGNKWT